MGIHSCFLFSFKSLNCHHSLLWTQNTGNLLMLECQRHTDQGAVLILEIHQSQAVWVFFIGIKGSSSFSLPSPPSRVESPEQTGHNILSECIWLQGCEPVVTWNKDSRHNKIYFQNL